MRPKPPCRKNGVDCPNRCVGCHATCKEFADYRAGIDADNAVRDKVREAEDIVNRTIWRKRHSLKHTAAGRNALAPR